MPKEMENEAIECAKQALQKHSTFGGMATHMKEHFDEKYEKKAKNWSCIVNRIREIGTNIGNVPGRFVYLKHGELAIILYKSQVIQTIFI